MMQEDEIAANGVVPRPAGLTWTAALMATLSLASFLVLDTTLDSFAVLVVLTSVVAVLSLIVVWFFWNGRNWARRLVLLMSVLSLLMMGLLPTMKRGDAALAIIWAVLGAWLLYWLNTKPVARYFQLRASSEGATWIRWTFAALAVALTVGVVVLVASVYLAPTERPVYGDDISAAHRESLRELYPENEELLGLFSEGLLDVSEEGCLFTDNRVVVFRDNRVRRQATYAEIDDIHLRRNTAFAGDSELKVTRKDGIELFCGLPNAGLYANDASEFHELITRAWRARIGAVPQRP